MKYKNQLIGALCLLLLSACSIVTKQLPPVPPPADLVAPCDDLPQFSGKDLGDLVQYSVYLKQDYRACALKHKNLGDLLTK